MLTAVKLRNVEPKKKPFKLADGGGLHLLVTPTGSAYWRLKYRVAGKEKVLALGVYRDAEGTEQVSLAEARGRRDDAKREMRDGKDPGAEKQSRKRASKVAQRTSFRAVAEEWIKKQRNVLDAAHADSVERSIELNLYPDLGKRPVAEIEAPELLAVLRKIESRGAHEIRSRVQQRASAVFRYGIANGYCQRDPAADLRGAFTPPKVTHCAALTAKELPTFFEKLAVYDGERRTQLAIRFLALTMVRTGELRGAEWSEFDLAAAEWRIPAERMKMGEPHIVPLSRQAIAILKELAGLAKGSPYVFPQTANPAKMMSENTILYALYRMGYHSRATGHGFRATASTILNEIGWNPDVIERQLAHQERNKVRRAYNRATHLPERKKMMQAWADMLDEFAKPKVERRVIAGRFGAKR